MKTRQAFTLIETVITITVIAVVVYAVIPIFATAGMKGVDLEVFNVAQSLAQGKIEEKMSLVFSSISSKSETNYPSDLSEYSYEVVVDYVSAEALNAVAGAPTDYKKIQVIIRNPNLANPTELTTLMVDL